MSVDEKQVLGYTYIQRATKIENVPDNKDKSEKTVFVPFKHQAEQKYIKVTAGTND